MGLDITHGAWNGPYLAFFRFRVMVAQAAESFGDQPGLDEFFAHSDCDGKIAPEVCAKLADEMEALLPEIARIPDETVGHIAHRGGYLAVTQTFIAGCRAAAAADEPLEFS